MKKLITLTQFEVDAFNASKKGCETFNSFIREAIQNESKRRILEKAKYETALLAAEQLKKETA